MIHNKRKTWEVGFHYNFVLLFKIPFRKWNCKQQFIICVFEKWTEFRMTQKSSQVKLVVKYLPANAGDTRDTGSVPGSGRSPGGRHGNPFQYSCLENPMDRGAWQATVYECARVCTHTHRHTHIDTHIHTSYGSLSLFQRSSHSRDRTWVSCTAMDFLPAELLGKSLIRRQTMR